MGSVGAVYTGSLLGSQVRDFLEGRVSDVNGEIPDRIVVYANNTDSISQFYLDMEGASQDERRAFLSFWSSKSNIHNKNAEASYRAAVRDAMKEIDPHTGTNVSEADARAAAEIVRADRSYDAIKKILDADRNGTDPRFGGITIERTRNRRT